MEIIVEIQKGNDGRPVGTVRSAGQVDGRPFSGNLEFLAVVEALYLAEAERRDNSERKAQ